MFKKSPMTQVPNIPLAVNSGRTDVFGPVAIAPPATSIVEAAGPPTLSSGDQAEDGHVAPAPMDDPALQSELDSLRASISRPTQAYVARYRSKVLHFGSLFELDNPPNTWRTRCGWSYGLTNFIRLSEIPAGGRKCHKCFALSRSMDQQSSDDEDESASSSVTSSSDVSSE